MGLLKLGLKTLTDPSLIIAPKHCHSERRPIRRDRPKSKNPWFLPLSRSFNLAITAGRPSSGEAPLPPLSPPVLASLFASDRGVLRLSVSRPPFAGVIFLASFLLFLVEPMAAKQLLPSLGGSAAVWITCLVFFQTALLVAYALRALAHTPSTLAAASRVLAAALVLAAFWAFGSHRSRAAVRSIPSPPSSTRSASGSAFHSLLSAHQSAACKFWWSRIEGAPFPIASSRFRILASLLALGRISHAHRAQLHSAHAAHRLVRCGFAALRRCSPAILTLRTRSSRPAQLSTQPADCEPALGRIRLRCSARPQAALAAAAHGRIHATQRRHQLHHRQHRAHSAALDSAARRLSPHHHPGLRVSPPAAARHSRPLSRGHAGRPGLHARAGRSLGAHCASASGSSSPNCSSPACSARRGLRAAPSAHRSPRSSICCSPPAARSAPSSSASPARCFSRLQLRSRHHLLRHRAAGARRHLAQRLAAAAALVRRQRHPAGAHHLAPHRLPARNHRRRPQLLRRAAREAELRLPRRQRCARSPTAPSSTARRSSAPTHKEKHPPPTTLSTPASASRCATAAQAQTDRSDPAVRATSASSASARERSPPTASPAIASASTRSTPPSCPSRSNVFTYIRESGAQVTIVDGDARTSLAREAPQHFNVLVVDAFSGDAIPLHLLTAQALALYRRHLAPGGIIAFHISNQHVDLEPAIALLAQSAGMKAMRFSSGGQRRSRRVQRLLGAAHRQRGLLRPAAGRRGGRAARLQARPAPLDRRLLKPVAAAAVVGATRKRDG